MDLSNILALAQDQGIVFWGAAVAIALGATLLVVALGQQIRSLVAGRWSRRSRSTSSAIPVMTTPEIEKTSFPAAVQTSEDDVYMPTAASLAYGQPTEQAGCHVMETPTENAAEVLTGLASGGESTTTSPISATEAEAFYRVVEE